MSYQTWCVEMITDILAHHQPNTGTWGDIGYESILKLLITHYADVYWSPHGWGNQKGGCYVNMWWDFNRGKKNYSRFFAPLLLSRAAKSVIENGGWEEACDLKLKSDDPHPELKIHFEHITPKSYIFNKLINRPENLSDDHLQDYVENCLKYNKIVVITKAESQYLDGAGMRFQQEDLDMLASLGLGEEDIQEAHGLLNENSKSHGSALLRMCRISRMCGEGEFCRLEEVAPLPRKEWRTYFDAASYPFEIPE